MSLRSRNRLLECDPLIEKGARRSRWGAERTKPISAPPPLQENWNATFKLVVARLSAAVAEVQLGRLAGLERDLNAIKEHCRGLRDGQSLLVPVETLAPEPVILKRSFQVVVRPSDGEYEATFFDANIGIIGDTEEEAVRNLKLLIVDTFEMLESNEASLGPEPARQLAVLREFLRRPD